MNSFRYGGVHLNCLPRPQVFTLFSLFSKQPVRWFSSTFRVEAKRRMPPKKTQEKETKTLLGRPGNNLKIGIVGSFYGSAFLILFSSDDRILWNGVIRSSKCRKIFLFQRAFKYGCVLYLDLIFFCFEFSSLLFFFAAMLKISEKRPTSLTLRSTRKKLEYQYQTQDLNGYAMCTNQLLKYLHS